MQALDPAPIIDYPDSDGKPMADNTEQARWILNIYANLQTLFAAREDVFVAADNLWYPVEGRPDIRQAPDVYVVFGRPKEPRGSYQQWKEGDVPIHVVFEILSPGNDRDEMTAKHHFYEDHGVEEYYEYDPEADHLTIWKRGPMGAAFQRCNPKTFVSPRLGIRFDTMGEELVIRHPDGRSFTTHTEEHLQRLDAERRAAVHAAERDAAAAERDAAAAERDKLTALRQEDRQHLRRLRDLSRLARAGQATPEQLAELERLENEVNGP